MAEELIIKVVDGQIYGWSPTPASSGLGFTVGPTAPASAGKWDWIGPVATGVGGAVTAWLAAKTAAKIPAGQAQQGVRVGATSSGLFGNIDTTTLLLIGGAALLFLSMPAKR